MTAPQDSTGGNADPVTIVQRVVPTTAHARVALTALHEAGWRIVRTEGGEFAGEDVQITDEWTPETGL